VKKPKGRKFIDNIKRRSHKWLIKQLKNKHGFLLRSNRCATKRISAKGGALLGQSKNGTLLKNSASMMAFAPLAGIVSAS